MSILVALLWLNLCRYSCTSCSKVVEFVHSIDEAGSEWDTIIGGVLAAEVEGYKSEKDWKDKVKWTLKSELTRRGISYDELSNKLYDIGIEENEANIRVKMSRGSFSAVFFFQCLEAIGCKNISLV